MPIFEYHCTECKNDFEVLVLSDQEVSCPVCKGKKVDKLLSTFSHKSKGGFSSSTGSSCSSCNATSCSACNVS